MEAIIEVYSTGYLRRFNAMVRESMATSELRLNPTDFYERFGSAVPEFPHCELEIVYPGDDFFKLYKLHVQAGKDSPKPFVCYPRRIATPEEALAIFRLWCLGTTLTVDCGIDLNTLFSGECQDDQTKFRRILWRRYRIRLMYSRLRKCY